jgi:hypothetical protein
MRNIFHGIPEDKFKTQYLWHPPVVALMRKLQSGNVNVNLTPSHGTHSLSSLRWAPFICTFLLKYIEIENKLQHGDTKDFIIDVIEYGMEA